MVVGGYLKGLHLRIGRSDSFADPCYQGGFILDAKGAKAAVLANQRTLVALCPFAPLSLEVGLPRHAGLAGKMSNNATSNVFATIWEAAIELENLEKNGETESSSARLCAKKFKFALGKRPVQSEFLRMPVLLHGPPFGGFDPSTKSKLAAERVHDRRQQRNSLEKRTKHQVLVSPTLPKFRPSLP
jgi:hypothetical protein